jgi:hypothetical protein
LDRFRSGRGLPFAPWVYCFEHFWNRHLYNAPARGVTCSRLDSNSPVFWAVALIVKSKNVTQKVNFIG